MKNPRVDKEALIEFVDSKENKKEFIVTDEELYSLFPKVSWRNIYGTIYNMYRKGTSEIISLMESNPNLMWDDAYEQIKSLGIRLMKRFYDHKEKTRFYELIFTFRQHADYEKQLYRLCETKFIGNTERVDGLKIPIKKRYIDRTIEEFIKEK